jgi:hypothetical protein
MTYTPDVETIQRKLRAVRMAAASAVGNGASEADILDAAAQGIREARELEARSARARSEAA